MDWLLAPIDATRGHDIGGAAAWHGRLMVLGWGILSPVAVLVARFFKILPGQDWPRELDNQVWWRTHWMGQSIVLMLTALAFALVWPSEGELGLHGTLGYTLLLGLILQVGLGIFRGSKGGPTESKLRGHHYDMTPWRRAFEMCHKALGYGVLALAAATILLGMWHANAPVWMWLVILGWWVLLVAGFVSLQKRGMAVDTYQAIWGDDPSHPGNRLPVQGWGMHRPNEKEMQDVRTDRRHRV